MTDSTLDASGIDPDDFSSDDTNEQGNEVDETPQDSSGGGHPAWESLLNDLPESLRPLVKPKLEEWDSGVSKRFEQIQEQYNPYKKLAEQGITPDVIEQHANIARMIESDPQGFYERMGQFYKFGQDQNSSQGHAQDDDDSYDIGDDENVLDPRIAQIEQHQEMIAQFLLKQHEEEQNAIQDAQLDTELTKLTKKYGAYDEEYVLGRIGQGESPEDAVKAYQSLVQKIRNAPAPGTNLPKIMSPGGGSPGSGTDTSKMSNQQKIVAFLEAQQNS